MRVTLYDSALVSRLRRAAVARRIRTGGATARTRWWKRSSHSSRRPLLFRWYLIYALWIVGRAIYTRSEADANSNAANYVLLSAFSLAVLALAAFSARWLAANLQNSVSRVVLLFYPAPDSLHVRWTLWNLFLRTLYFLPPAAALYFFAIHEPSIESWLFLFAAALASWFAFLALICLLTPFAAVIPSWLPAAIGFFAAAILFAPPAFEAGLRIPFFLTPIGWINFAALGLSSHPLAPASLLTLLAGFALAAFFAYRLLLRRTAAEPSPPPAFNVLLPAEDSAAELETLSLDSSAALLTDSPSAESDPSASAELQAALPSAVNWQKQWDRNHSLEFASFIQQTNWLELLPWDSAKGLEWIFARILTPKDRPVAAFLLGGHLPEWTSGWTYSLYGTAAAVLFAVLPIPLNQLLFAIAAVYAIVRGLPLLGGDWPGFSTGRISGRYASLIAVVPIGYWRASSVIFKGNLLRILAWSPFTFVLAAAIAHFAHSSPLDALDYALRFQLLLIAAVPFFVTAHFSQITNDSSNRTLIRYLVLAILVPIVIFVIVLAFLVFASPSPAPALSLLALAILSTAGWAIYGRIFERSGIDLLRISPR